MGQKQLGKLVEKRMANTMPDKKRGAMSSTSKAIGLNDELINAIGENEDLQYMIKLSNFVHKVKVSNHENSSKIGELGELFVDLHKMLETLQKNQSKSGTKGPEKKKEEAKGGAKK